ncbi:hypothetical protein NL676_001842 [Syzygium grande]|nr:hypothetical protein NL676_001842 [Syzygium grande]
MSSTCVILGFTGAGRPWIEVAGGQRPWMEVRWSWATLDGGRRGLATPDGGSRALVDAGLWSPDSDLAGIRGRRADTTPGEGHRPQATLGTEVAIVHFRSLERPKEDDFVLELSKLHNYDEVVERVAQQVGLDDPSKIRLTSHNCYSQQPKPQPIRFRGVERLSDMLVHYNQTSDILYYEVLDIPLPELQGLKNLKVAFHHASKDEVVIHHIRLPKQSTVGDVINELKTKANLSRPNAELRLLEVFLHKIYKIFPSSDKIENINDQYWTLRAEEIPEEEKDLGPHDRVIYVYHFMKETPQNQLNFGEPFLLVIHEGETLAEAKVRIQKKLQVPDDAFAKWKFAFLSLGRPEYLEDSEILSNRFQRRDGEQYLGLEHSDAPKRSYVVNQNRHTHEKPVKIYN